jgi:O-antigen ligase
MVLQLFIYEEMSPALYFKFGLTITPDRVLFLVIITFFLKKMLSRSIEYCPINRIEIYMVLFTIFCFISWYSSEADAGLPRNRWLTTIFQITIFPFTIYGIMRRIPYEKYVINFLFKIFFLIGLYLTITAFAEHFAIKSLVWPKYILDYDQRIERALGPFNLAITLGWMLIFTMLVTAYWFEKQVTETKKVFLMVFSFFTLMGIYFTYTRQVWLGVIWMLFVGLCTRTGIQIPMRIITLSIVLFCLTGIGSKFSLFENSLFSRRQNTVDYRLVNYALAWHVFKQNPILGVGYGKFGGTSELEQFYLANPSLIRADVKLDDGNHNLFLGLLADLGIIGFTLYISIIASAFLISLRVYRRLKSDINGEKTTTVITIVMLGVFIIIANFGDLRFHIITHTVLFMLVGIVFSLDRQSTEIEDQTSQAKNIGEHMRSVAALRMARQHVSMPSRVGPTRWRDQHPFPRSAQRDLP